MWIFRYSMALMYYHIDLEVYSYRLYDKGDLLRPYLIYRSIMNHNLAREL